MILNKKKVRGDFFRLDLDPGCSLTDLVFFMIGSDYGFFRGGVGSG